MLPISYAIRNLFRVPARCAQIVLGAALVIVLLMLASALSDGMDAVLRSSGSDRNVILLGSGSEDSVERSEVNAAVPSLVAASVPGIKTVLGRSAVSGEIHYNGFLTPQGGMERRQSLLRGVTPAALLVHPEVRLIEGTFPLPGEAMVGRLATHKMRLPKDSLKVGEEVQVGDTTLTISGIFQAPGTVMEAEVWTDLGDMLAIAQRDTISCAVVRLGEAEFGDVEVFTLQRLDLELVALRECRARGCLCSLDRRRPHRAVLYWHLCHRHLTFGAWHRPDWRSCPRDRGGVAACVDLSSPRTSDRAAIILTKPK